MVLTISCDCGNLKTKQRLNSNPPQPTDNSKCDSNDNIREAVRKLKEEIKTPNSDPKLIGIYETIKSLGKHAVYTSTLIH